MLLRLLCCVLVGNNAVTAAVADAACLLEIMLLRLLLLPLLRACWK